MPTSDALLAAVLRAFVSRHERVRIEEYDLDELSGRKGYKLWLVGCVEVDGLHARVVQEAADVP